MDVSKGESQVQAFLEKGKPFRKSFKVSYTLEGLGLHVEFLEEVKRATGQKPPIILESTGHYHLFQLLEVKVTLFQIFCTNLNNKRLPFVAAFSSRNDPLTQ